MKKLKKKGISTTLKFIFIIIIINLTVYIGINYRSFLSGASNYKYKIDFGSKVADIEAGGYKDLVLEAVSEYRGKQPYNGTFYLQSANIHENWIILSLVSPENSDLGHGGYTGQNFKIILLKLGEVYDVAISTNVEEFKELLDKIPENELSADAKKFIIDPTGGEFYAFATQNNFTYKFPWPKGYLFKPNVIFRRETNITSAWHRTWNWQGTDTRSIDFLPLNFNGYTTSVPLYASANGRIVKVCNTGSQNQGYVYLKADGEALPMYIFHFNARSIRVNEGDYVTQGTLLGYMNNSTATKFDGCGYSTDPHVHIEFPYVPFKIDGYDFDRYKYYSGQGIASTNGAKGPSPILTPTPTPKPTTNTIPSITKLEIDAFSLSTSDDPTLFVFLNKNYASKSFVIKSEPNTYSATFNFPFKKGDELSLILNNNKINYHSPNNSNDDTYDENRTVDILSVKINGVEAYVYDNGSASDIKNGFSIVYDRANIAPNKFYISGENWGNMPEGFYDNKYESDKRAPRYMWWNGAFRVKKL